MPIYEYQCENGHVFEEIRSMLSRDFPITCEECGEVAIRNISRPGNVKVRGGTPKHH